MSAHDLCQMSGHNRWQIHNRVTRQFRLLFLHATDPKRVQSKSRFFRWNTVNRIGDISRIHGQHGIRAQISATDAIAFDQDSVLARF